MPAHTRRPPLVAGLGAEVHDPIGVLDDLKIVLDHEQAFTGLDEALEDAQQLRHVVEVQAGGRLVEEMSSAGLVEGLRCRSTTVADEFEALRLAAGKRVERLAEAHVAEAHVGQRLERADGLSLALGEAGQLVQPRERFAVIVISSNSWTFLPPRRTRRTCG